MSLKLARGRPTLPPHDHSDGVESLESSERSLMSQFTHYQVPVKFGYLTFEITSFVGRYIVLEIIAIK